jgi:hypothetical protein
MIFVNALGVVMMLGGLLVGTVVWGGVSLITADSRLALALGALWGMGATALSDLWYRARHSCQRGLLGFFGPTTGGSLSFIPLWLLVGAWPLFGLVRAFSQKMGGP